MVYGSWSGTGSAYSFTSASLPAVGTFVQGSLTGQLEVQYDFVRASNLPGTLANVILMTNGIANYIFLSFQEGSGGYWYLKQDSGGTLSTIAYIGNIEPAVGTVWRIKIDIGVGTNLAIGGQYTIFNISYSANGGSTWSSMILNAYVETSTDPTAFNVGLFFQGVSGSATTGPHIGNIVVQDVPPPAPNCRLRSAYVCSSGRSVGFQFETISSSALVTPTALNYLPSFRKNGIAITPSTVSWVNGRATRAIILLPEGIQSCFNRYRHDVSPGVVDDLWCGQCRSAVSDLVLANYVGVSAFGTDTLVKTLGQDSTSVARAQVTGHRPISWPTFDTAWIMLNHHGSCNNG